MAFSTIGNATFIGATEPERITGLSAVSSAASAVEAVAERLDNIAKRLVGSWPEHPSKAGNALTASPCGILNQIRSHGDDIYKRCSDMHEALSAIESHLP